VAREAGLRVLSIKPWLQADYLLEYAEWAYAAGGGPLPDVVAALTAAADALLEIDRKDKESEAAAATAAADSPPARGSTTKSLLSTIATAKSPSVSPTRGSIHMSVAGKLKTKRAMLKARPPAAASLVRSLARLPAGWLAAVA